MGTSNQIKVKRMQRTVKVIASVLVASTSYALEISQDKPGCEERAQKRFEALDTNEDGLVTSEEYLYKIRAKQAAMEEQMLAKQAMMQERFNMADMDEVPGLSFEEFFDMKKA